MTAHTPAGAEACPAEPHLIGGAHEPHLVGGAHEREARPQTGAVEQQGGAQVGGQSVLAHAGNVMRLRLLLQPTLHHVPAQEALQTHPPYISEKLTCHFDIIHSVSPTAPCQQSWFLLTTEYYL